MLGKERAGFGGWKQEAWDRGVHHRYEGLQEMRRLVRILVSIQGPSALHAHIMLSVHAAG